MKNIINLLLSMLYISSMYADTKVTDSIALPNVVLSEDKIIQIEDRILNFAYYRFWVWGYNAQGNPETIADHVLKSLDVKRVTIPKGFRVINFGAKWYVDPECKISIDIDQTKGTQMDFEVDSLVNINDIESIYILGDARAPYNADNARVMQITERNRRYSLKPDITKISPNNPGDMNNRLFVVTNIRTSAK